MFMNAGTHKRSKDNIWGDLSLQYVRKSNESFGTQAETLNGTLLATAAVFHGTRFQLFYLAL